MGQKVNPTSFRLGTPGSLPTQDQWATRSEMTAIQFHRMQRLKEYIFSFLRHLPQTRRAQLRHYPGLCQVHQTPGGCYVFFYYFARERQVRLLQEPTVRAQVAKRLATLMEQPQKPIQLYLLNVEQLCAEPSHLRQITHCQKQYARMIWLKGFQQELFALAYASLYLGMPRLLAEYLAVQLERTPFHRRLTQTLFTICCTYASVLPQIGGLRLQVKGKLNGHGRSKILRLQAGRLPLSTRSASLRYEAVDAFTPFGVLSVKLWLYLRQTPLLPPVSDSTFSSGG